MSTHHCFRAKVHPNGKVSNGLKSKLGCFAILPLGESGVCKRSGKSCGVVRAQGAARATARTIFCEVRRGAAPLSKDGASQTKHLFKSNLLRKI